MGCSCCCDWQCCCCGVECKLQHAHVSHGRLHSDWHLHAGLREELYIDPERGRGSFPCRLPTSRCPLQQPRYACTHRRDDVVHMCQRPTTRQEHLYREPLWPPWWLSGASGGEQHCHWADVRGGGGGQQGRSNIVALVPVEPSNSVNIARSLGSRVLRIDQAQGHQPRACTHVRQETRHAHQQQVPTHHIAYTTACRGKLCIAISVGCTLQPAPQPARKSMELHGAGCGPERAPKDRCQRVDRSTCRCALRPGNRCGGLHDREVREGGSPRCQNTTSGPILAASRWHGQCLGGRRCECELGDPREPQG